MTKPVRIQLSRRKGFNLMRESIAANGLAAVNVARPGKWGNPFYRGCGKGYGRFDDATMLPLQVESPSNAHFVAWFKIWLTDMRKHQADQFAEYIAPLRGNNLACWCKDGPCHADVLLEIANHRQNETER